jgi:hypothetical protein
MEKLGSFFYGLGGFIAGGLLMVAGWWISMLNIRVDNFQDPNFTSFWTLFGLVMIFIGAYLPFMIVGLRGRFVRKRKELDELNRHVASQHNTDQPQPSILPGPETDPTERP